MEDLFSKKKIFKNCLMILFGISLCQSCIKKNLPDYYMDDNFKSYVDFPKGSYWIYQEKMGSEKSDSIYLYQREYSTDKSGKYVSYNYDRIDLSFYSSNFKDTLRAGGGGYAYINSGFFYYEVPTKVSFASNVQYYSSKGGVKYVFDFSAASKILYKDSLGIYNVYGIDYKQVKVFENLIKSYGTQPQIIYYAKNVGVIRKELFNGEVWELKSYFINK